MGLRWFRSFILLSMEVLEDRLFRDYVGSDFFFSKSGVTGVEFIFYLFKK